jgi:hypothetical protein
MEDKEKKEGNEKKGGNDKTKFLFSCHLSKKAKKGLKVAGIVLLVLILLAILGFSIRAGTKEPATVTETVINDPVTQIVTNTVTQEAETIFSEKTKTETAMVTVTEGLICTVTVDPVMVTETKTVTVAPTTVSLPTKAEVEAYYASLPLNWWFGADSQYIVEMTVKGFPDIVIEVVEVSGANFVKIWVQEGAFLFHNGILDLPPGS